jgi:hypothetical protein
VEEEKRDKRVSCRADPSKEGCDWISRRKGENPKGDEDEVEPRNWGNKTGKCPASGEKRKRLDALALTSHQGSTGLN